MKKIEITIGQILKVLMYGVIISLIILPLFYIFYLMIFNCEYAIYLIEDTQLSSFEHLKFSILLIGVLEIFVLFVFVICLMFAGITKLYDKIEHIKIFTLSSKTESKPNHKAVEDIKSEFGINIH